MKNKKSTANGNSLPNSANRFFLFLTFDFGFGFLIFEHVKTNCHFNRSNHDLL